MQLLVYFAISETDSMSLPSPVGMAEPGKFMAESYQSGRIVPTGQLPATSTCVQLQAGAISVSDGPFIEG